MCSLKQPESVIAEKVEKREKNSTLTEISHQGFLRGESESDVHFCYCGLIEWLILMCTCHRIIGLTKYRNEAII